MMTLKLKYMNCINIKVLSDTNKIEVSNKLSFLNISLATKVVKN